jgi:hypothetical protein
MDQFLPLNLTPEQEQVLRLRLAHLEQLLANWRFNDPANDQLLMRQHAAISGERDGCLYFLTYDAQRQAAADAKAAESFNSQE